MLHGWEFSTFNKQRHDWMGNLDRTKSTSKGLASILGVGTLFLFHLASVTPHSLALESRTHTTGLLGLQTLDFSLSYTISFSGSWAFKPGLSLAMDASGSLLDRMCTNRCLSLHNHMNQCPSHRTGNSYQFFCCRAPQLPQWYIHKCLKFNKLELCFQSDEKIPI